MDILGNAVSTAVEDLVNGAKVLLVIVTPYFDPWDRVGRGIKAAKTRNVRVSMLLRGGKGRGEREAASREYLDLGIGVKFLNRLHAKVYINESELIVTSLNLLKTSALDSFEVGVRFRRVGDEAQYNEVVAQVAQLIARADQDVKVAAMEQARAPGSVTRAILGLVDGTAAPSAKGAGRSKRGHCVRCSADIALNPERPFCADCYKAWSKYSNADYAESHCHGCGKERSTTAAKPLCKSCWQASA